jgi:hypothetical protein
LKGILMRANFVILRTALSVLMALTLIGCNLVEPIEVAGFTLHTEEQAVFQNHTQQICSALENAGYIMPYGPPLSWYHFDILQSHWVFEGPTGTLLTIPSGRPHLHILVDWGIPADLNMLPDAVSQDTVDMLAEEASNICRIVQQEAQRNGIGPIDVSIWLWDLPVGLELEYGAGSQLLPTNDCERIAGAYIGKSIGLNPQEQTLGLCPSLYVPN